MDFSNNPNLKDYLHKKEMTLEAKKAIRNKIIEEQNRQSWIKYQDFLRNQLAANYEIPVEPIITNDLLLYYDAGFETSYTGTGASIIDISQNNRNGTIVGSPNWNSKGWFDFSNDYIITPDLDQVVTIGDEAHSVEVWVYPTNNGVIASYLGSATIDFGYHFSAIELVSGQVQFGLWNGTTITSTGPTGALTFNQWHQIVLTYNGHGSPVKGYVDGALAGQTANMNWDSPMDGGDPFYIAFGAEDDTDQGDGTYFDGRFAIARVYGRALTDAEVIQNYTSHHRRFVYNG
jgi:hypothetical protein